MTSPFAQICSGLKYCGVVSISRWMKAVTALRGISLHQYCQVTIERELT